MIHRKRGAKFKHFNHFSSEIKPGNAKMAIEMEVKAILLSMKLIKAGKLVNFIAHLPEAFTMLIHLRRERLVILKAAVSHFTFTRMQQSLANIDILLSIM